MERKLKDLRNLLCILLAVITLLSVFPMPIFADDDDWDPGGTDEKYFVSSRDELKQIFNLDLQKLILDTALGYITGSAVGAGVAASKDVLAWLAQRYTFVVVKRYTDKGQTKTKIYVNAPNIQQLLQNVITSRIPGGWKGSMWTPGDNLITSVGKIDSAESDTELSQALGLVNSENVMTKFGFNIPVPRYEGEYPSMYMSMNNVIPTKWYQILWRLIKSIFGFSFINPPDDENFKTLGYWGNLYTDVQNEQLIQYVQYNWLKIEDLIYYHGRSDDQNGGYFGYKNEIQVTSPLHCANIATTTLEYNAACEQIYDNLIYKEFEGKSSSRKDQPFFVDIEEALIKVILYKALFKDKETFLKAPAGPVELNIHKRKSNKAWQGFRNDYTEAGDSSFKARDNGDGDGQSSTVHNQKYYLEGGKIDIEDLNPQHDNKTGDTIISEYLKENPSDNIFNLKFEYGKSYDGAAEYELITKIFGVDADRNKIFKRTLGPGLFGDGIFTGIVEGQQKWYEWNRQLEINREYFEQDTAAWLEEQAIYDPAYRQYLEDLEEYNRIYPKWEKDRDKYRGYITYKKARDLSSLYSSFATLYNYQRKGWINSYKKQKTRFLDKAEKWYNKNVKDGTFSDWLKTYCKFNSTTGYVSGGDFLKAYKLCHNYSGYCNWKDGNYNGDDPKYHEPEEPQEPPYPKHYDPKHLYHSNKTLGGRPIESADGKPLEAQYRIDPEAPNYLKEPDYWTDMLPKSVKDFYGWTDSIVEPNYLCLDKTGAEDDESALIEQAKSLIKNWNEWRTIQKNYNDFNDRMNNGTKLAAENIAEKVVRWFWSLFVGDAAEKDNKYIFYSQCLLNVKDPPNNSVENCKKVYGETTVYLTFFHYYIASGAWLVTRDEENNNTDRWKSEYSINGGKQINPEYLTNPNKCITREEAIRVILCLQSASGQGMEEGWKNLIKIFETCAEEHPGKYVVVHKHVEDNRIMPYDRDTLISSDKKIITIYDPRVELYKHQSFLGGIITGWHFNVMENIINAPTVFEWFSNLVGKITKITVFINSLCSFEFIEKADLSPTTMWKKFSSGLIISLLMAVFIIQLIIIAFKYSRGKAGLKELLSKVLIFILILSVMMAALFFTDKTWNTIKHVFNVAANIGENAAIKTDNIEELYGDGQDRGSVNYYLPYFNTWATFMTGHSLRSDSAVINYSKTKSGSYVSDEYPEVDGMIAPAIVRGGTRTRLWAVALADAFNTNGENLYTVSLSGKNENTINKNAYRVVDHFLAPRLRVTNPNALSDGNLYIENKDNENYNGKFQNMDITTMISAVMTVINLLIIVIIKFLTFLYLWYMLYILIFNILLSSTSPDGKSWKIILLRTFSPILFIILIGLYSGLIINLSFLIEGVVGIILNIGIFFVTAMLLSAWEQTQVFPFTLKPVYLLLHPLQMSIGLQTHKNDIEKERTEKNTGMKAEDNIDSNGTIINDDEEHLDQQRNHVDEILLKARTKEELTDQEKGYIHKYHLQNAIDNGCKSIKDYQNKINNNNLEVEPDNMDEIKYQFWYNKQYNSTNWRQNHESYKKISQKVDREEDSQEYDSDQQQKPQKKVRRNE